MPAIDYVFATDSGDVTTTGTTYVDIGCTATLSAGRWLVIGQCSFRDEAGAGGVTDAAEVEARHESTRIAVGRWCSAFGQFNTGDAAAGSVLQFHAVLDVSEGDEVSMWLRRIDGGVGSTVRAGHASYICINLDGLTEGADYWFADSASGDTSETSITDTSFHPGDSDGQLEPTIPSTGDYLWIASAEGFSSGTTADVNRGFQARWEIDGSTSGVGIEVTQNMLNSQTEPFVWPNYCVIDVRNHTASDTPLGAWMFANRVASSGTIGFRRTRTFVLRLGVLTDYAFITNAGGIQASGGSDVEGTNGLSFDSGADDYVVLGASAAMPGTSDWGDAELHRDESDLDFPPGGKLHAMWDSGDMGGFLYGTVQTAGSHTWRLVQRTDPSATTYTLGRNTANNADTRTPLIAFTLSTAATNNIAGDSDITVTCSGTLTGQGAIAGASSVSCTVSGTIVGTFSGSASAAFSVSGTVTGIGAVAGSASVRFRARFLVPSDEDLLLERWRFSTSISVDTWRPRVWSVRNS